MNELTLTLVRGVRELRKWD